MTGGRQFAAPAVNLEVLALILERADDTRPPHRAAILIRVYAALKQAGRDRGERGAHVSAPVLARIHVRTGPSLMQSADDVIQTTRRDEMASRHQPVRSAILRGIVTDFADAPPLRAGAIARPTVGHEIGLRPGAVGGRRIDVIGKRAEYTICNARRNRAHCRTAEHRANRARYGGGHARHKPSALHDHGAALHTLLRGVTQRIADKGGAVLKRGNRRAGKRVGIAIGRAAWPVAAIDEALTASARIRRDNGRHRSIAAWHSAARLGRICIGDKLTLCIARRPAGLRHSAGRAARRSR